MANSQRSEQDSWTIIGWSLGSFLLLLAIYGVYKLFGGTQ